MSNFICKECGMTNIDCGGAGYKTPKEIELEKKLALAVKALKFYAEGTLGSSFAKETLKNLEEVTTKPIKEMED